LEILSFSGTHFANVLGNFAQAFHQKIQKKKTQAGNHGII
jgi:hypothetical protein